MGILLGDTCGYDPDMTLVPPRESSLETTREALPGGVEQREKLTRMFFRRLVNKTMKTYNSFPDFINHSHVIITVSIIFVKTRLVYL